MALFDRNKIWLWSAILFLIGLLIGFQFSLTFENCKGTYSFLDPDINCEVSEEAAATTYRDLEKHLNDFIKAETDSGHINTASLFFRDLKTKLWFGVNENNNYSPGSLVKLPIMVAYFRAAEIDPSILSSTVVYNGENRDALLDLKTATPLETGKTYVVNDLIEKMIQESSNDATVLLYNNANQEFMNDVFVDLGIYVPHSGGFDTDFLSAKTFANALRMLYNATYLKREYSQKALDIMTHTNFYDGLIAGLPIDIKVAHKFGERVAKSADGKIVNKKLHDCGIIYYPDRPYILCVMTEGKDFTFLQSVIKNISLMIYEALDKKNL